MTNADPAATNHDETTAAADSPASASDSTFLQFLSGLAGQTLIHLGVMANPLTNKSAVDLPNAKYSIDILAAIQEKTQGNLNAEEDGYLQAALHDLRLHYVRIVDNENDSA